MKVRLKNRNNFSKFQSDYLETFRNKIVKRKLQHLLFVCLKLVFMLIVRLCFELIVGFFLLYLFLIIVALKNENTAPQR